MTDEAPSPPAASERTPCDRCGTYAELVDYDGHQICEDCIDRLSEIERTPPTVSNVLSGSLWLLSKIGLPAALIVALADLPIVVLENLVPELPALVSAAWGVTVSVLAQGAVFYLAQRAIRGETLDVRRAVKISLDGAGPIIVNNLVAGIQVGLLTLLLIVPGVIRGLSLALVIPIAVHEGASAPSVLDASVERMKGHRLTALAAYLVWGSAWMIAFFAYFALSFALELAPELGLGLKVPESVLYIVFVGGGLLLPVLAVPVMCTTAVLYAKTLRYRVY